MSSAWHKTLAKISDRLDPDDLNLLIALRPLSTKEHTLILEAATPDTASTALVHQKALEAALGEATDGELSAIDVRVRKPGQQELFPVPPTAAAAQQTPRANARLSGLSPKYTFDSFVV